MSDLRGRNLTATEHIAAEQGLLNLALREEITILDALGRDITPGLVAHAPRINANYDRLHQPASPSSMPGKSTKPLTARPPRVRRVAKAQAGPPKPAV